MILLYALIVLLLGIGAAIASLRVRLLESKFVRAAKAADQIAKDLAYRGGNCNLPDPLKTAKRQFELGRLVQVRDRYEERYDVWENRANAFRGGKNAILAYQGRFVPYAFGVIDFLGIFAILALTDLIDPSNLRLAVQTARMLVVR